MGEFQLPCLMWAFQMTNRSLDPGVLGGISAEGEVIHNLGGHGHFCAKWLKWLVTDWWWFNRFAPHLLFTITNSWLFRGHQIKPGGLTQLINQLTNWDENQALDVQNRRFYPCWLNRWIIHCSAGTHTNATRETSCYAGLGIRRPFKCQCPFTWNPKRSADVNLECGAALSDSGLNVMYVWYSENWNLIMLKYR